MRPPKAQAQWEAFQARTGPPVTREEAERIYPDLLSHIRATVSIVDLIRESGIDVEPLSPDAPDVYVARAGCPSCGGNAFLKEG